MKRIASLLTFLSICLFSTAQSGASQGQDLKYSSSYMSERYTKREVKIRMRDGVELFTAIYEPKDNSVAHPIMMERTCYGVSPYGEDRMPSMAAYAPYVDAGYIFVRQDVRGKNMSGGEYEDIRPFIEGKKLYRKESKNVGQTDEASDTYDTVEWLVNNTNCNGNVGVKGISYPGFYATMAALSGHPAVKAVSPQAPVTDWFLGDDVHHNGAFMLSEMISFQPYFEFMMDNRNVQSGKSYRDYSFPDIFHSDIYSDYLRIGTFMNICEAYGDSLSYLRVLREHPNWDEYWESHTVSKGHLHDVMPAVMVVGGLFDKEDCYGALDTYKSMKEQSPETDLYLVEGPWYHGAWTRSMTQFWSNMFFGDFATSEYYMENIEYPFFAYYLEGKGEKPSAEARIFDSGTRRWKEYKNGWPEVARSETTPFYLNADGTLSTELPTTTGTVSYTSDPAKPVPYRSSVETSISLNYMIDDQRFAAQRPDVVCFETEPLKEELAISGEVEVDLFVDISTTDADFVVKVIDVFPDDFSWYDEPDVKEYFDRIQQSGQRVQLPRYVMGGYQFMVRGDVMRGKFRESFAEPKAFEPGKTTEVRFNLTDVSHTFKPGHRLMVQVQSSWFPLVDRNPQTFCNIYTCDESDYQKSEINIHCGKSAASSVRLPVVR